MKLNAEWQRSPAQGMAGSEPPSGSRGFTGSAGRISFASGCSAVSVRFSQVCFPLYRVSNLDSVMSSHCSGTWPSRLNADCDDPVRDSCLAPPPTAYSGLLHQVDLVLRAQTQVRCAQLATGTRPSASCGRAAIVWVVARPGVKPVGHAVRARKAPIAVCSRGPTGQVPRRPGTRARTALGWIYGWL